MSNTISMSDVIGVVNSNTTELLMEKELLPFRSTWVHPCFLVGFVLLDQQVVKRGKIESPNSLLTRLGTESG